MMPEEELSTASRTEVHCICSERQLRA